MSNNDRPCTCGAMGLGGNGFHYPGAHGCLVDEQVVSAAVRDLDDATTRPLGPRLLAAWSASGLPLGRLLVEAAGEGGWRGPAEAMPSIPDDELVEMVEQYVDRARRDKVDRR